MLILNETGQGGVGGGPHDLLLWEWAVTPMLAVWRGCKQIPETLRSHIKQPGHCPKGRVSQVSQGHVSPNSISCLPQCVCVCLFPLRAPVLTH